MPSEKPLQDAYIKLLEKLEISYLHIPNRTFGKRYKTPLCLKHFPDLFFLYNGVAYFREFGIAGTHKARKEKQFEYMCKLRKQGADILIINNEAGLVEDWQKIGLSSPREYITEGERQLK